MNETTPTHHHVSIVAAELSIPERHAAEAAALLGDGATIPFIARYRKERTGNLDEVALTAIRDRITQLRDLDTRRQAVIKSLTERNLLTNELETAIHAAVSMTELEDIYLPYRPKRRTRAMRAREKGLEPLAARIYEQPSDTNPEDLAAAFVSPETGVESMEDALAGARDIIAEWIAENAEIRAAVRKLFLEQGQFRTAVVPGRESEGVKFQDYFDAVEPVRSAPSHRILAMRRGEKEGFLSLRVDVPDESLLDVIEAHV
ncbi:MAG TPA: Tex-like N-terminal domain-containing protein, partial [bacterium]|nr:Tex-like N-terminal domain-containing protein [bacterium]